MTAIRIIKIPSKVHQVNSKDSGSQNFSPLAVMVQALGVAQILYHNGDGG
jgi:hypothetical protein